MVRFMHRFTFYLQPRPPYNFDLTVHKPAGWPLFTPAEVFDEGALWTALHIDGQLTCLKLSSEGTIERPLVQAKVFLREKPSPDRKEAVRQALSCKLNITQDLGAFYYRARRDPILRHTVDNLYGMHDTDPESLFANATLALLFRTAPFQRNKEMIEYLTNNFGELAGFCGKKVRVWPTPEKIASLDVADLEKCGLGYRAKYIQQLAVALASDSPSFEDLRQLPQNEARRRLLSLPGIGNYSADLINPHKGFPIDTWSAEVFGKLFFGHGRRDVRETIDDIRAEGLRRWGDYAWMAFLYIVHDLEGLSRELGISIATE
jgi:3-methyladenine DNA glycosylase/8-oxoguanine DNA glycosylase